MAYTVFLRSLSICTNFEEKGEKLFPNGIFNNKKFEFDRISKFVCTITDKTNMRLLKLNYRQQFLYHDEWIIFRVHFSDIVTQRPWLR